MIKLIIGSTLGIGMYFLLSFYQPMLEASKLSQQAEASSKFNLPFVSPIPPDLLIYNK